MPVSMYTAVCRAYFLVARC